MRVQWYKWLAQSGPRSRLRRPVGVDSIWRMSMAGALPEGPGARPTSVSAASPMIERVERRPLRAARIAAIDDEPANLRLLERAFEQAGYRHFEGFTDPVQALDVLASSDPDLVLLDIEMRPLGGLEVLGTLRARALPDAYLPILVMTGDQDRATRRRALDLGATDFLTKPFDLAEMLLRSRNLIEARLLHAALATRIGTLGSELEEHRQALESATTERAAVAASLGRVSGLELPEEIGAALCADLASVIGARFVTLLVFETHDRAVAFVAHGARSSTDVGYTIPADRSRELWQRASVGPWVEAEVAPPERGRDGERLAAAGWRSAIYAPLRSGEELLGLLSVGSATRRPPEALARDLPCVVQYATVAGALLGRSLALRRQAADARRSIELIIRLRALTPVFQPIVSLSNTTLVGQEALTRFTDGTRPDQRFAEAASVGLGVELEMAAIEAALDAAERLPVDTWLSLNLSPAVVLAGAGLADALRRCPRPLVVELTEHARVEDYAQLRAALRALGPGVRIAVDDAGAGYASMQHVVELQPDFVKLDISLVRGIDRDPARQALVAGMCFFAQRAGLRLIGEGIESDAELRTLAALGVPLGQGYLLGRPRAVPREP